jgi:nucleoside triphosphate diphosphatase
MAPPPAIDRLLEIMARLRDPRGGCPWDLEQDFGTIAPYTIEEAYEVADAIERGDMAALKDELGDLLFQVVFYAQMAREAGLFAFDDIVEAISDKMVRRHPHVFGDADIRSEPEQRRAWEAHKAAERETAAWDDVEASVLAGVARALPALMRAEKLQKRAARVGFDWPSKEPVFDKISEEIAELQDAIAEGGIQERLEDEVGDLLFAVANIARHLRIDPEAALRHGNDKFERRFRAIEERLRPTGRKVEDCSLDELEAHWQAAKRAEDGLS